MTWLFGLLTSIPELLKAGLAYLNKKQDASINHDNNARDVDVAVLSGESVRVKATSEQTGIAMGHPIWWFGWGLFVFPVGLYHACIFWVSTFPTLGWHIDKVPPDQGKAAYIIMMSFFGVHVVNGVVNSVLARWK